MIGAFLARFAVGNALSRVPWQLWVVVAFAAVLSFSAWRIAATYYDKGFNAAEVQWETRVAEELERQAAANAAALEAARADIERLNAERQIRNATIERLTEEALRGPYADRPSISVDGVRRLNSILD